MAKLEMTITKNFEETLRQAPFFLEIEMLQGQRILLSDGMISYNIEIEDEGKCEIIKEFILKTISKSQKSCLN